MASPASRQFVPLRYWLLWIFSGLMLLYVLAPIIFVIVNSFSSVAYNVFPPPGFSLRWYEHVLQQKNFFDAFYRSIYVALITTGIALAIGTIASLALVRSHFRGREALKAFFLSPIVMPKIVLGVAMFIFFVKIKFYGNVTSLILSHIVITLPFVVAVVTANLIGLNQSLEEAAMDLGATRVATFFRVILPQIWPGLIIAGIFSFITSFDQVETSIFLVRPENNTLPIEMFLYMEKWQDPTIAALSALLIAFSVVVLIVTSIVLKKVNIFQMLGK